MRIALLADVHGNHLALEAVARDIEKKSVDLVYFLGDYVFGAYGSNETVDLLLGYQGQNKDNVIISGNIDELIRPIEENADWVYPVNRRIYDDLGRERIAFLKSLPSSCLVEVEGIKLYLCHNPAAVEVFTMVDELKRENNIPDLNALASLADGAAWDVCLFGHYHLFMDEQAGGKGFICPGSVGMPFNGDPRAQYAILELQNHRVTSSRQYVEYDRLQLVKGFEDRGYLEEFPAWSMASIATIVTAHNYMEAL